MPDSSSLRLVLQLGRTQAVLMTWLVDRLQALGHVGLTAPALDFLGQLDCGINYASDVARALGVSRQMVAKTVADLVRKGWLKQVPDPERGNRKVIRFTAKGERVMSDARAILEEMDGLLDAELGRGWDERLTRDLEGLASSVGRS